MRTRLMIMVALLALCSLILTAVTIKQRADLGAAQDAMRQLMGANAHLIAADADLKRSNTRLMEAAASMQRGANTLMAADAELKINCGALQNQANKMIDWARKNQIEWKTSKP